MIEWDQNEFQGDWLEGVEQIHLAQDGNLSQALVNTVMNLWVLEPQS
jgi:hypothetical protein